MSGCLYDFSWSVLDEHVRKKLTTFPDLLSSPEPWFLTKNQWDNQKHQKWQTSNTSADTSCIRNTAEISRHLVIPSKLSHALSARVTSASWIPIISSIFGSPSTGGQNWKTTNQGDWSTPLLTEKASQVMYRIQVGTPTGNLLGTTTVPSDNIPRQLLKAYSLLVKPRGSYVPSYSSS